MSIITSLFILYEGSIQLKVRKALSGTCNPGSQLSPFGSASSVVITMLLANAIKRKAARNWKSFFSTFSEKAAAGLFNALGKLQPKKKICNGGGCERKHEVVNQSEKEQNFQGAANTILKRSFLEKTKKNSFLGDGQKKDKKTEKEKELEEKK